QVAPSASSSRSYLSPVTSRSVWQVLGSSASLARPTRTACALLLRPSSAPTRQRSDGRCPSPHLDRSHPGPGLQSSSRSSWPLRSEEHTSELQSLTNLVCRL